MTEWSGMYLACHLQLDWRSIFGVIALDPRLKTSGMTGRGWLLGYAWLVIFNLIGDLFFGVDYNGSPIKDFGDDWQGVASGVMGRRWLPDDGKGLLLDDG